MAKVSILDRYVAKEVLAPFAVGVALLTFALVTGKLLKLTEMVVNHGVGIGDVLALVGFIMPAFLELTLPMALLLGVLLGFGRMSGDREMTAARACGVSLYRLAAPAMAVAMVVYALSSWFAFAVRPWANSRMQAKLFELSRTQAAAGLKEKVFDRSFSGLVVYVDRLSHDGAKLTGVMISDARTPVEQNTIIARHGLIIPDERNQALTLRLFDGSIFGVDSDSDATHVTSFSVYDLTIHPDESLGFSRRDPDEISYRALRKRIEQARNAGRRDYPAEAELAGKYTIPLATLLFALLGIPLGLKPARGGQSERFGLSVALFFLYYALMHIGQTLAERGSLNAFIAMAIPDLVLTLLALWLFVRAAEDRGDQGRGPGDALWTLIERYQRVREAA